MLIGKSYLFLHESIKDNNVFKSGGIKAAFLSIANHLKMAWTCFHYIHLGLFPRSEAHNERPLYHVMFPRLETLELSIHRTDICIDYICTPLTPLNQCFVQDKSTF